MAYEMEKEIFEQPDVLESLIKNYIDDNNNIKFNLPEDIKRIIFIASGSSYNCGGIVSKIFREYANIKAYFEYASEFYISKNLFVEDKTLYVFISQSGETFDTVKSLQKVKEHNCKTMCVTNGKESTLWKLCDYKILSDAGEEKSIASTKALTAQLVCIYLIMLEFLKSQGHDITDEIEKIKKLPDFIRKFLSNTETIREMAQSISKYPGVVILGGKSYYSIAKEGALKIKETSYLDANAYPQGEFLHGHMAILNNHLPLISIMVDENKDNAVKVLNRITKDYHTPIFTISNDDFDLNALNINIKIDLENVNQTEHNIFNIYNIFAVLITLQLTAFEIAKTLDRNIDTPIGLNKVIKE